MRGSMRVAVCCAVSAGLLGGPPAAVGSVNPEPFVPPHGRVLVFIGQDCDAIDTYVKATGLEPAGVMTYTSIQELRGLADPVDYGAGIQHAARLLERYPRSALQIGLWMVGGLEPINRGLFDDRIDRLAQWIARANRPVYLRIGYEFDYPPNGYPPEVYVAAFRRIVGRFREAGVRNVAFVWHSYAGPLPPGRAIGDWYPGDDVVDWAAVSYFKVEQEPDRQAVARFAREHGKPLMIAESSPMAIGVEQGQRSWDAWFAPWLRFISDADARAVCYINNDWDAVPMFQQNRWGDARVQRDPEILARWIEALKQSIFLHASPQTQP